MVAKSASSAVLLGLAIVGFTLIPMLAVTPASSFGVTATVADSCVVSASATGFAARVGTAAHPAATVSVACANSTPYSVGLSTPLATGMTLTASRQTGPGSALLSYALFPGSEATANSGPAANTHTVTGTGIGPTRRSDAGGELSTKESGGGSSANVDTIVVTVIY